MFARGGDAKGASDDDARPQIERAERWTREHPTEPSAFYVLGALCAREQLWGKAQLALQRALELSPDARLATAIHFEFGRLFERIDEVEKSRQHFRSAAATSVGA